MVSPSPITELGEILRSTPDGGRVLRSGDQAQPPAGPNRPPRSSAGEEHDRGTRASRFFHFYEDSALAPGDTREQPSHGLKRVRDPASTRAGCFGRSSTAKDAPQEPPSVVNFRERDRPQRDLQPSREHADYGTSNPRFKPAGPAR